MVGKGVGLVKFVGTFINCGISNTFQQSPPKNLTTIVILRFISSKRLPIS
jgi:hypothetical protein